MKKFNQFVKALADDDELVLVRKSDCTLTGGIVVIKADASVETLSKADARSISKRAKRPRFRRPARRSVTRGYGRTL